MANVFRYHSTSAPMENFPTSDECPMSTSMSNPLGRQRMVDWLRDEINGGQIPGLQWLDKRQSVFKVPWKNVSNKEWSEADGGIFKVSRLFILKKKCFP